MISKLVLRGDYRRALTRERIALMFNRAITDRAITPSGPWWDTIITDPPYGDRTHTGARTCAKHDTEGVLAYDRWTPDEVYRFVTWAAERTRRWIAPMTSHDLIPAWEAAYDAVGMYRFAPVPILMFGGAPRKQGDGPTSAALYLMPARHRTRPAMANPRSNGTALWRSLPGGYTWHRTRSARGQGYDKPIGNHGLGVSARGGLWELIRDYSNVGDLVCDPLAGYGSTLIAACQMGRLAIGAEINTVTARIANKEIVEALRGTALAGHGDAHPRSTSHRRAA